MGDFIFKISGPQRAMEVQIPVGGTISKLDMVKNLITGNDEDEVEQKGRKKKKKKKTENDPAKVGMGTVGVLLASVLLAAMKDD